MFPPFPQELALHYLRLLQTSLDKEESSLLQLSQESESRKNQGIMLGCLVCLQRESGDRKILYAVSGIAKELKLALPGIVVTAIAPAEKITKALAENDAEIHRLTEEINKLEKGEACKSLQEQRRRLTDQSLQRVFDLYNFTRFDGKKISLNEIILKHGKKLPPTGTGDCCAPKLLSYAFSHDLTPVSMAEIFYGQSSGKKLNGHFYPPCDERCSYILPDILGLEILYRDKDIVVVNKSPDLLSVAGRGEDKQDCLEARLRNLFPLEVGEASCQLVQPAVHRLDMETSGLLLLAMNKKAHAEMNRQFAEGQVQKKYVALLDGILRGKPEGITQLRFRLDVDNRPYQIYDEENGKLAVTEWHKLAVEKYVNPFTGEEKKVTRIEFFPKTGRTHQLRLTASDSHGLGLAILGDSLYGKRGEGERLMLHAAEIIFLHPRSHRKMIFTSPPDF